MKIILVVMMSMVFTNAFATVENGDCYRVEGDVVRMEGNEIAVYRCNKATSKYERTVAEPRKTQEAQLDQLSE